MGLQAVIISRRFDMLLKYLLSSQVLSGAFLQGALHFGTEGVLRVQVNVANKHLWL